MKIQNLTRLTLFVDLNSSFYKFDYLHFISVGSEHILYMLWGTDFLNVAEVVDEVKELKRGTLLINFRLESFKIFTGKFHKETIPIWKLVLYNPWFLNYVDLKFDNIVLAPGWSKKDQFYFWKCVQMWNSNEFITHLYDLIWWINPFA